MLASSKIQCRKKEVASGEQRNPKTPGFPGRNVPHLWRSEFCLPRTQRLRARLKYAAPPALQKRERRLEAGGTSGGRGKARAAGENRWYTPAGRRVPAAAYVRA